MGAKSVHMRSCQGAHLNTGVSAHLIASRHEHIGEVGTGVGVCVGVGVCRCESTSVPVKGMGV